jgi:hypothetical protein
MKNKLLIFINYSFLIISTAMLYFIYKMFINGEQFLYDYQGKMVRVAGGVVVEGLLLYCLIALFVSLIVVIINYLFINDIKNIIKKINLSISVLFLTLFMFFKVVLYFG